jgi:hypothetical protein
VGFGEHLYVLAFENASLAFIMDFIEFHDRGFRGEFTMLCEELQ